MTGRQYVIFNGHLVLSGEKLVGADNRGLRYGDGLFETMKAGNGQIPLASLHFERLFSGMRELHLTPHPSFDANSLTEQILSLCYSNGHSDCARVRLMVIRGDVGAEDPAEDPYSYIIQTSAWKDREWNLNENGLTIGVFPDGYKASDRYANIKSNNYLLYRMASHHAHSMGWNDSLVLNGHGRIADSTIANCWISRDGILYTPPLSEGCVAGVMRRWLLERLSAMGYVVVEQPLTPADLVQAEELFLTNALRGLQWVRQFDRRNYSQALSTRLVQEGLFRPLSIR